jgi:hypothetical protein
MQQKTFWINFSCNCGCFVYFLLKEFANHKIPTGLLFNRRRSLRYLAVAETTSFSFPTPLMEAIATQIDGREANEKDQQ